MNYIISETQLNTIINYLGKKPFQEVALIIQEIGSLKTLQKRVDGNGEEITDIEVIRDILAEESQEEIKEEEKPKKP